MKVIITIEVRGREFAFGVDSFEFKENLEAYNRAIIALCTVAEYNVQRCMRDPTILPNTPPWLQPEEVTE